VEVKTKKMEVKKAIEERERGMRHVERIEVGDME